MGGREPDSAWWVLVEVHSVVGLDRSSGWDLTISAQSPRMRKGLARVRDGRVVGCKQADYWNGCRVASGFSNQRRSGLKGRCLHRLNVLVQSMVYALALMSFSQLVRSSVIHCFFFSPPFLAAVGTA